MFAFSESLTVKLPKLGGDYDSFGESAPDSGIVVEIDAIHEGLTANFNMYTAQELVNSLESWVVPYARPIITNHDTMNEPIGRVMAARMDHNERTKIKIQAAIKDHEAVEKFRDGRYLTGSVGGKATEAICSICGVDWAAPSDSYNLPCEHSRGNLYEGKMAWLEMRGISWKEYSMVNVPADSNSTVSGLANDDENDTWVKASVFAVDMNKESIISFGESEAVDILANKKRKEAISTYHDTRGAFLSAFVTSVDESPKETEMPTELETEDDILAVSENLSDALATDPEPEEEEVVDESPEGDAPADEDATETDAEEVEVEGGEGAEDGTAEEEADADAEVDEETEEVADDSETPAADDEDVPEEEDETPVADAEEAEADAVLDEDVQGRVTALEATVAELTEENSKLRGALKKGLAERVVDMKIDLGHENVEDRSNLVESHVSRSASSLADSLKDLRKAPVVSVVAETATVEGLEDLFEGKALGTSVKGDTKVTTTTVTEDDEPKIDPSDKLEGIIVEGLMGRKVL